MSSARWLRTTGLVAFDTAKLGRPDMPLSGVQHLVCPEGRLPASTEGQFSMNIRQSLTDYSATSTAPSAISATPSQLTMVSFSPSNKLPKIATSTTLSLSTGATCAALPSLSARK